MDKWKLLAATMLLLAAAAQAGEAVNINTASAEQIAASLDGIGLSKAQAIVQYRDRHGGFKHRDELINVKGIGLATVEKNRDYILFSDDKRTVKAAKKSG